MVAPFNIAIKAVLKQLGKGSARTVPEDIMSGTIRRIKQEAQLPEFKREAWWKDPERVKVKKEGLESLDEIVEDYVPFTKVDNTQDVLTALGRKKYPELNKNSKEQIKKIKEDMVEFQGPKKTGTAGQRLSEKEQNVYKNPDLEKAATKLNNNEITFDEFKEIRDTLKPLKVYSEKGPSVPTLYDDFDILAAIDVGKKRDVQRTGIVGVNKNIKQGTEVTSRFDINAYKKFGRYVVTITDKAKALFGYAPTAILKNVKFAGHIPPTKESALTVGEKSFKIAQGGGKSPFAVMEGKWQDVSPKSTQRYALNLMKKGKVNKAGETHKEWTEIGFDPSAKLSFYNRSTGEPIFEADKVVQVGGMLLARGIQQPSKEQIKQITIKTLKGKQTGTYKHGGKIMAGGLSNLKKSININGQPHSLAWINPDEASALKAMGGSGKPGPMGIPSYQEADPDAYVDASADIVDTVGPDEGGYSWDWGPTGGYSYATDTRAEGPEKTGYSDEELRDYAAGLGTTVRGLGPIGTERAKAEHHDTLTDIRKGLWGDDYLTRGEVLDRIKGAEYSKWRNSSAGRYSHNPEKDYDEWFAAQDPNALIEGGYGAALTANLNIVNQQLINRAKENLQKKAASPRGVTDKEREKHGRQSMIDAAKSGKIEHLEDFTEKKELPAAMQFSLTGQLMKLASRTVIGTGTVGGVGVHVHEDGSVTAISPEDSPGYDYEAHHEPGSDTPIKKKKLLPRSVSSAAPVEKELTGMEALLASRPKATARKDSNVHLSALLDQIYGEGQGQELLG